MYKVIGIGNNKALKLSLKKFIDFGFNIQCIITLEDKLLPENSFSLEKFSKKIGCDFIKVTNINLKKNINIISKYNTDIIFSIWPKILSNEIISIPKLGVIGSHPAPLPFNRGRHPIHWQITQFIKKSKLTYFLMDGGVDTGKIILQIPYNLKITENINDINNKLDKLNEIAVEKISKNIIRNKIFNNLKKQDNSKSNYWRKKTRHDVLIDFRMNEKTISSIVRSFTSPYPCAFFVYNEYLFHIKKSQIIKFKNIIIKNIEPGRIIKIRKNKLFVKCLDKIIKLDILENEFNKMHFGNYIHPPSKYLTKHRKFEKLLNL